MCETYLTLFREKRKHYLIPFALPLKWAFVCYCNTSICFFPQVLEQVLMEMAFNLDINFSVLLTKKLLGWLKVSKNKPAAQAAGADPYR